MEKKKKDNKKGKKKKRRRINIVDNVRGRGHFF